MNAVVTPTSYLFTGLTLCGVIIKKRGQLKMGRGNKSFFQICTENAAMGFWSCNDHTPLPHVVTTLL